MPMLRPRSLPAVLAVVLAASACSRRTRTAVDETPVAIGASSLGAGDVIEVRVYQEPELSGVYQVGRDGDVIFPLCKRVTLSGLSPNAAAERLRKCLGEGFMRDPQVSVLVKEYNSKKVFVFGEVQKPGTFVYEDGMSIVQAVTLAGGFTKTASQNSTSVTRRVNGQEVKVKVNVQDIALGKAPNFSLEPGDIVYVPESLF
ncbi:MAG TPA: polysaccharide biosynthesis/export family protein [Anaeromyxobacter sp.]